MDEITMPQLGQSVEEASIVEWLKREGDTLAEGEPLCTVQTDKAEIEVESTVSGVLRKILVEPDVLVPVLTVIALAGTADEALPDLSQYEVGTAPAPPSETVAATAAAAVQPAATAPEPFDGGRAFVSPRARARAKELGIAVSAVPGTGPRGRVVAADVLAYAEAMKAVRITPTARRLAANRGIDVTTLTGTGIRGKIAKRDVEQAPAAGPAVTAAPQGTRVPLTPMRRVIAKRMTESKFAAPHYYITVEADMSAVIARYRNGDPPFKPSYNDLVLAATVKGLVEHPSINATWDGDAVVELSDVNLGVAVALPTGLIVPVLKQAQTLSLEGIHGACRELTEKARDGKLLPDDYAGSSFTVSNLGAYGVDHFTAIINQPDSAILAVGQIKDRPVVVDGEICSRPIMKLTMSSDHRVIDGAMAAQFMGRLKEILETADLLGERHD